MKKLTFLAIAMIAFIIAPLSLGAANPNKILIAYFSWGGNTEAVANYIANQTQGELFRIEPVVPYPSDYTLCTEVALEERDTNARPAIKDKVANWNDYDVIFIGCPVWWHEAPMIIHTFAERLWCLSALMRQHTATRHLPRLWRLHLMRSILKVSEQEAAAHQV